MKRELVPDDLWNIVGMHIPTKPRRFRYPGRKPIDNRTALRGILFVLKTGIPWEDFPAEMGCSGMTLWRRLRDWQSAGVWQKIHEVLLALLRRADRIDFSRVVVDSASVRAVFGGPKLVPALWTGAKTAPNITSSPMPKGHLWQHTQQPQIDMMLRN